MSGDQRERDGRLVVGVEVRPVERDEEFLAFADDEADSLLLQRGQVNLVVTEKVVDLFDGVLRLEVVRSASPRPMAVTPKVDPWIRPIAALATKITCLWCNSSRRAETTRDCSPSILKASALLFMRQSIAQLGRPAQARAITR